MEEKKIEKILNSAKKPMLIFLVVSILAIVAIVFAVSSKNQDEKELECKDYAKIIGTSEDVENEYVKVNVIAYAAFVEMDDTSDKFCFVIDEEGGWYIARLSQSTMDKLDLELADDQKTFSYELKGCTDSIPTEVRSIAMDTVNEWYEDEEDFQKITLLNFENIFGKYYIDDDRTPNSETYYGIIGVSAVVLVVSAGAFIGFAISRGLEKKTVKEFGEEELRDELRDESITAFDKQKVYLTRHYVISGNGRLKVVKYEDIGWTYIMHQRTNGIETGIFLVLRTLKGKTYNFGYSTKNAKENLELAIEEIMEKNKDALIGYTTENMKAYKQIVKDNK